MLKYTLLKRSWALLAPLFLISQTSFAMGPTKPLAAPSATPSPQCLELNRYLAPHVSKEFFSKDLDQQIEELQKLKTGFVLTDIEIDPAQLRKVSKRALNEFLGQFLRQGLEGRDLYISIAAQRGCEAMNFIEAMGLAGAGANALSTDGKAATQKADEFRAPEADFPIHAGRSNELRFSFSDTVLPTQGAPSTQITVRKVSEHALEIETEGNLPSLKTQAIACSTGIVGEKVHAKARFRLWIGEQPQNTEVSDRLLVLLTQLAEETANGRGDGCEAIFDRSGVIKRPAGGGSTSEYQPSNGDSAGSAI